MKRHIKKTKLRQAFRYEVNGLFSVLLPTDMCGTDAYLRVYVGMMVCAYVWVSACSCLFVCVWVCVWERERERERKRERKREYAYSCDFSNKSVLKTDVFVKFTIIVFLMPTTYVFLLSLCPLLNVYDCKALWVCLYRDMHGCYWKIGNFWDEGASIARGVRGYAPPENMFKKQLNLRNLVHFLKVVHVFSTWKFQISWKCRKRISGAWSTHGYGILEKWSHYDIKPRTCQTCFCSSLAAASGSEALTLATLASRCSSRASSRL